MDDVLAVGLIGDMISWIDERFGRHAAWIAAIILCLLPFVIVIGVIWHLTG